LSISVRTLFRVAPRRTADPEVGLARLHERRHALCDAVAQPHDDAAVPGVEGRDDRGQQGRRDGRQRRHGDDATPPSCDVPRVDGHRVDLAEHAGDNRQKLAPDLRQRDGARGAIEEPHAQRVLEMADPDGERGLRHVQRLGGAGEVSEAGDPEEGLQLAEGEIHSGAIWLR